MSVEVPSYSFDPRAEKPADIRVLLGALAGGVVFDLAVRSGVVGVAGTLSVLVVVATLLLSGRLVSTQSRFIATAAALFAPWLTIRTSFWLVPFDMIAIAALLLVGVSLSRSGNLFDLSIAGSLRRVTMGIVHVFLAPGFLAPLAVRLRGRGERRRTVAAAVLRGVMIAAPLLLILGLLLASADAVFAEIFDFGFSAPSIVDHVFPVLVGAWGVAGLLRIASAKAVADEAAVRLRVGRIESLTVLSLLVALFGVFVGTQFVTAMGGAEHVLETAGLTYAEYARTGFFQLLFVAAITLVVLGSLQSATELPTEGHDRRVFIGLAEAAVVLTIVIVVVALRKLQLYQDAFGLTMLRLFSEVFALWMALVLVMVAMRFAGVWPDRRWLLGAAGVSGLTALFALNAVNPEAYVARYNIEHPGKVGELDVPYLDELGGDAVPAILDAVEDLPEQSRLATIQSLCAEDTEGIDEFRGWAAYNYARDRAEDARADACASLD